MLSRDKAYNRNLGLSYREVANLLLTDEYASQAADVLTQISTGSAHPDNQTGCYEWHWSSYRDHSDRALVKFKAVNARNMLYCPPHIAFYVLITGQPLAAGEFVVRTCGCGYTECNDFNHLTVSADEANDYIPSDAVEFDTDLGVDLRDINDDNIDQIINNLPSIEEAI